MSDNVNVTNFPSDNSYHRVAFDLMKEIRAHEGRPAPEIARERLLTLYRQCLMVVYHEYSAEEAMGTKNRPSMNFG